MVAGASGWAAAKIPCPYLASFVFGKSLSLDDLAIEVLKLGPGPLSYRFLVTASPTGSRCVPGIVEVTGEDDVLDLQKVERENRAKVDSLQALRLLKRTLGLASREESRKQRSAKRHRAKRVRLRDGKGEAIDLKPAEDCLRGFLFFRAGACVSCRHTLH